MATIWNTLVNQRVSNALRMARSDTARAMKHKDKQAVEDDEAAIILFITSMVITLPKLPHTRSTGGTVCHRVVVMCV